MFGHEKRLPFRSENLIVYLATFGIAQLRQVMCDIVPSQRKSVAVKERYSRFAENGAIVVGEADEVDDE